MRAVLFYQLCTSGHPADLVKPRAKISSVGLPSKIIFSFEILSNVRIKPHPQDRLGFCRLGILFHGFRPKLKKSLKDQFTADFLIK